MYTGYDETFIITEPRYSYSHTPDQKTQHRPAGRMLPSFPFGATREILTLITNIYIHEQRNKKLRTQKSRSYCGVQPQIIMRSILASENGRTIYGNGK